MLAVVVIAVIAALIVAVLGYAATRPDTFRIQRQTTINAPPERVFDYLDDFRRWGAWSPWEAMDPTMSRTHTGAPSGVGAVYAWDGNKKVGRGRMEIIESIPPSSLRVKLDFLKPFEAHNTAEFSLQGKGDTTHITWAMTGPSPYVMRVMTLFFSMDSMVGKDFEAGLANLKRAAEGQPERIGAQV